MQILIPVIFGLFAAGMLVAATPTHGDQNTSTPLEDGLKLETTVLVMTIPENNELPWGHVRGSVNNPADEYPVIIQFYKEGSPVHMAQVEVDGDYTYDYKFRVRNVADGQTVNVFEGSYTIKIFKVVKDTSHTI